MKYGNPNEKSINLSRTMKTLARRIEYLDRKLTEPAVTEQQKGFIAAERRATVVAIACVEMVRGYAIVQLLNFADLTLE